MSQPEIKTANPPPPQTEVKPEEGEEDNSTEGTSGKSEDASETITVNPESTDTHERPLRTVNPPPINIEPPVPPPQQLLPNWDDIPVPEDLPPGTPTPGLALSHDHSVCYNEWFAEISVHPHVRRYGGRILMAGEESSGTQISCTQDDKTALLNKLREAGVLQESP